MTQEAQELLLAAKAAVDQLEHSNRLILKLLTISSGGQLPLADTIARLRKAIDNYEAALKADT